MKSNVEYRPSCNDVMVQNSVNTGRFIMYSGITKIYYRKAVGHVFTKPVQIEGTTQTFFPPSKLFLTLRRLMSYIYIYIYIYIYMEHPFLMFLDHTQRRSTVGRTPLDE